VGGALRDALLAWIGARIDAAHATPETGLVALSFYTGERKVLGAGIGPRVAGVGVLPRLPRLRAGASHPLVAALRAHLVGHRLREVVVGPEGLQLIAGGEEISARLELAPGRRGEARVIGADGALVLRWPPARKEGSVRTGPSPAPALPTLAAGPSVHAGRDSASAAPSVRIHYPADPVAAGAALLAASEAAAGAAAMAALARAAKARRAALERRAEAVRGDLSRLGSVVELQKIGRLLLAQAARIPRGATEAALDDWEAGGSIEVALDPARPAKQQAEAYFAKARRYQRGEAVMRRRLAETERALEAALAFEAEIAAADAHPEVLEALSARARALGASGAGGGPAAGARAGRTAERRPFHVFRSAAGAAILVGRGGKDNDALTTKHARPHDLWLHAKGIAGAHVVARLDKGASCPAELLVDAATLAAHFSDARGEATCEVSYVLRRHVRKPRGSAPGAVTYDREKVIVVRIEKDRLERLLASKEDA
jgi:hypothetical protein